MIVTAMLCAPSVHDNTNANAHVTINK